MFDKNVQENTNYIEILDKVLEVERIKKRNNPVKITVCIVAGIVSVMLFGVLCYLVIKTGFSLDSIVSMLLAFFSIFISIFFYFKADETSTNFYKSSYEFMKDISVTLGKIEERFGEKLNSLNDKISHLDRIRSETSAEIKDKTDDKDKIINDLMNKANLNEEEKRRYKKELAKKDEEIEALKNQKWEAERLRDRITLDESEKNLLSKKVMLNKMPDTYSFPEISLKGIDTSKFLKNAEKNLKVNDIATRKL